MQTFDRPPRAASKPSLAAATAVLIDNEFEVVEAIGSGSHADVFAAHQLSVGRRRVAVKVLSSLYLTLADGDFRRAAAALVREAELLGSLHSACFVDIYRTGTMPDRRPYMAMELAIGTTLWQLMQQGTMTAEIMRATLEQWSEGLAELHALGWVHRDVTPANCVVSTTAARTLHVLTYDLGTASPIGDKPDRFRVGFAKDRPAGTPAYMAPEQAQGGVVDGRADQYALAAIAYEALGGKRPVPTDTGKAAAVLEYLRGTGPTPAVPLHSLRRDLPVAMCAAVDRGLSRNPDDRFADIRDFADEVTKGLQQHQAVPAKAWWTRLFGSREGR